MSNTWYYVNADRERHGPVDAAALKDLAARGDVHARTLVWREGLPQWQPLAQVAGELGIALGAVPPPPTPSEAPPAMASDPAPMAAARPREPAADDALAAAYAASSRDAAATMGIDADDVVDAGFWKRLAAFLIDAVILTVAVYAIVILMLVVVGAGVGGVMTMFEASATGQPPSGPLLGVFLLGFYVLPFVMRWAYFTFLTASSWQGTLGKRAVGIKVVDLDGNPIGKGRATGRWFAAALSYLTLYIGFLMAAFTDRKMALHDMVASTRVVDRWAYTEHPERQNRKLGGCAIAALIGLGLFFILFFVGVIAAVSLPAYQDYTQRAKLAQVVAEGRGMGDVVAEFRANTDRCPADLEEAGLSAPTSALVESTEVGEMEDGQCAVQLQLGGPEAGTFVGEYLWFTVDGEGNTGCSGSMDDKYLPFDCRD